MKLNMIEALGAAAAIAAANAQTCSFRDAPGLECWGLTQTNDTTAEGCSSSCCSASGCQTWQFCPPRSSCQSPGQCWIGKFSECKNVSGWVGGVLTGLPLVMNLTVPQPQPTAIPLPGKVTSPDGHTMGADSMSVTIDGIPWFAVSGEMQYSRVNASYWRRDLLKLKAGGLDMVGTYVFWIHHEEQQGVWDWTGDRDLRTFVTIAGEVGLKVFMRLGPWAHGECRNGGFPDWLLTVPGIQIRTNTTLYMGYVQQLYTQIATQLQGLYWYQGGPIVGAQVDNEYSGSSEYLVALRDMAMGLGILPAYFTKTGWPSEPQPYGAYLPEFGGYPDGFWDRSILPNIASYFAVYMFEKQNKDANTEAYPMLMVEAGGGMETSYHRRVRLYPQDVSAPAAVFIGSGAASLGYYIYHGGTHPVGQLSTTQEQQLGYEGSNDMPVKNYDFNAPIGYQGQLHGSYHELRRVHLTLRTWGSWLGHMPAYNPDNVVTDPTDTTSLRWAARSDGTHGLLILNTFQRNTTMSDVTNVTLNLELAGGSSLVLPPNPAATGSVTIPAGTTALLPFNFPADYTAAFNISSSAGASSYYTIAYSYLTPVTNLHYTASQAQVVLVMAASTGMPTELAFADPSSLLTVTNCPGTCVSSRENGNLILRGLQVASGPAQIGVPALVLTSSATGAPVLSVLVLDWPTSAQVYQGTLAGQERLLFSYDSNTSVTWDGGILRVEYETAGTAAGGTVAFGVLPAPASMTVGGQPLSCNAQSLVTWCTVAASAPAPSLAVTATLVQPAGPARVVPIGKQGVAAAPNEDGGDDQWQAAAVYQLSLNPAPGAPVPPLDGSVDIRLRLDWVADAARLYPGPYVQGQRYNASAILGDCFYNTDWCELPFTRLDDPPTAMVNGLLLKVLPLSAGAPIFLPHWPQFAPGTNSTLVLNSVVPVQMTAYEVTCA